MRLGLHGAGEPEALPLLEHGAPSSDPPTRLMATLSRPFDRLRTRGEGRQAGAAGEGAAAVDGAIDWAEVRRAYEFSGETVRAIRERFGLTKERLRWWRESERWTNRPPATRPKPFPASRIERAATLSLRLQVAISFGLDLLERRIAEEGLTDANARTLTELCRAQEILMRSIRTDRGDKTGEKSNKNDGPDRARTYSAADIAQKRADLERRILAIRRERGLSGGDRPGDG